MFLQQWKIAFYSNGRNESLASNWWCVEEHTPPPFWKHSFKAIWSAVLRNFYTHFRCGRRNSISRHAPSLDSASQCELKFAIIIEIMSIFYWRICRRANWTFFLRVQTRSTRPSLKSLTLESDANLKMRHYMFIYGNNKLC